MRTCGPVAIFCGALWDATVCRPAKLRWSRNLNRDSRACRNTGELGNRLLVTAPYRQLDYLRDGHWDPALLHLQGHCRVYPRTLRGARWVKKARMRIR